ncbi:rhodanese-like domain-containing protein [Turneriella parva]|uniref:Rhodanese-like protein n=1 Tax=Turneriella parva (strain ATCC BAA-1111 / DSM 21527 / NCTC 11395 / H) TaxID=869212 RepID=I4B533_TURPD|nr:rhodanese-like domain-containing protein [Turneriella parva]AFM12390.1 Rhodanese-like protein [Turneriella parva DSM 21527]
MVEQLSVHDLKKKMDAGEKFLLVDVRNDNELDICKFETALHIPLHLLTARYTELPQDAEIILTCHHGGRSMQAANFLVNQGYRNVSNLMGGIDAWASHIDPNMAKY